ncbi:amidohydrolase family protein [Gramella sp. YB25]|uniref:Amidohydrolase family protein n=1 Tax=Christiangramia crocea TaxID=2904124 RepID=A0A9X1UUF6_9FLAO|nr:amidohydrolase family protein [Gramella crocea]
MELLVKGGLSPVEALRTATINPARYLKRENEIGTIESGKIADLILLNANPLQDISNTQNIEAVMFQGHLLNRSKLDKMLLQLKKDAENWSD